MIGLVAAILSAILVALPLSILPWPLLAWLAVPAFVVTVVGVLARSVPLATAGASLATIEYALALVIVRPPADVVTATAFGTALLLLLALVHFADHVHGAAIGPSVIRSQIRHGLVIVAVGGATALVFTICGTAVRLALPGAALPVILVGALGALLTVAGAIALVANREEPGDR